MTVRQCGKKSNHGLNYQEGPGRFALINELAIPEAQRIIDLYTKEAYPGLTRWWAETAFKLRQTRTLVNCFGRKWLFKGPLNDETLRQAISFVPQSTVVDMVNRGLIQMDKNLPRMKPLIQKHDEILYSYRFDQASHCFDDLNTLCGYISPVVEYGGRRFDIKNEFSCGLSWGGLQKVEINEQSVRKAIEEMASVRT